MVKKVTTISIDEDILRQAKKEVPNISIFVEDCLKAYLGFNNSNVKSIDENLQTIRDCLLSIELASKQDIETEADEKYTTEQEQKVWSKLFGLWRSKTNVDIDDWENASKILKVTVRELQEIMEIIEYNGEILKGNDWSYAKTLI